MLRHNFVKDLQDEVKRVLDRLNLLRLQGLFLNFGNKVDETHEDKLIKNVSGLQWIMLAIVYFKNTLEKVTDLDLYTLVSRIDQVAH